MVEPLIERVLPREPEEAPPLPRGRPRRRLPGRIAQAIEQVVAPPIQAALRPIQPFLPALEQAIEREQIARQELADKRRVHLERTVAPHIRRRYQDYLNAMEAYYEQTGEYPGLYADPRDRKRWAENVERYAPRFMGQPPEDVLRQMRFEGEEFKSLVDLEAQARERGHERIAEHWRERIRRDIEKTTGPMPYQPSAWQAFTAALAGVPSQQLEYLWRMPAEFRAFDPFRPKPPFEPVFATTFEALRLPFDAVKSVSMAFAGKNLDEIRNPEQRYQFYGEQIGRIFPGMTEYQRSALATLLEITADPLVLAPLIPKAAKWLRHLAAARKHPRVKRYVWQRWHEQVRPIPREPVPVIEKVPPRATLTVPEEVGVEQLRPAPHVLVPVAEDVKRSLELDMLRRIRITEPKTREERIRAIIETMQAKRKQIGAPEISDREMLTALREVSPRFERMSVLDRIWRGIKAFHDDQSGAVPLRREKGIAPKEKRKLIADLKDELRRYEDEKEQVEGILANPEEYLDEYFASLDAGEPVETLSKRIRDLGGIRYPLKEVEEYLEAVPLSLRRARHKKQFMAPDEMAAALGFDTDDALYEALKRERFLAKERAARRPYVPITGEEFEEFVASEQKRLQQLTDVIALTTKRLDELTEGAFSKIALRRAAKAEAKIEDARKKMSELRREMYDLTALLRTGAAPAGTAQSLGRAVEKHNKYAAIAKEPRLQLRDVFQWERAPEIPRPAPRVPPPEMQPEPPELIPQPPKEAIHPVPVETVAPAAIPEVVVGGPVHIVRVKLTKAQRMKLEDIESRFTPEDLQRVRLAYGSDLATPEGIKFASKALRRIEKLRAPLTARQQKRVDRINARLGRFGQEELLKRSGLNKSPTNLLEFDRFETAYTDLMTEFRHKELAPGLMTRIEKAKEKLPYARYLAILRGVQGDAAYKTGAQLSSREAVDFYKALREELAAEKARRVTAAKRLADMEVKPLLDPAKREIRPGSEHLRSWDEFMRDSMMKPPGERPPVPPRAPSRPTDVPPEPLPERARFANPEFLMEPEKIRPEPLLRPRTITEISERIWTGLARPFRNPVWWFKDVEASLGWPLYSRYGHPFVRSVAQTDEFALSLQERMISIGGDLVLPSIVPGVSRYRKAVAETLTYILENKPIPEKIMKVAKADIPAEMAKLQRIAGEIRALYDELHSFFNVPGYLPDYAPHKLIGQRKFLSLDEMPGDRLRAFFMQSRLPGEREYTRNVWQMLSYYGYRGCLNKFIRPNLSRIEGLRHVKMTLKDGSLNPEWMPDRYIRELRTWMENVAYPGRDIIDRTFASAMSVGYFSALGMNPGAWVMQKTQELHNFAALGAKYWLIGQKQGLTKEGWDIVRRSGVFAEYLPMMYRELQTIGTESFLRELPRRFRDIGMAPFQMGDRHNRVVAFLGARQQVLDAWKMYKAGQLTTKEFLKAAGEWRMRPLDQRQFRRLLAQGDIEGAARFSGFHTQELTNYVYSRLSTPPLFRGKGRVFGMFATFPLNTADMFVTFLKRNPAAMGRYVLSALLAGHILGDRMGFRANQWFFTGLMPYGLLPPIPKVAVSGSEAFFKWVHGKPQVAKRELSEMTRVIKSLGIPGYTQVRAIETALKETNLTPYERAIIILRLKGFYQPKEVARIRTDADYAAYLKRRGEWLDKNKSILMRLWEALVEPWFEGQEAEQLWRRPIEFPK